MNKQLLNAAHEAYLKGYDIKVVFSMHDKVISIGFGKKKARKFTNFAKALNFFNAGLEFMEADKALGAKRREEAGAEEPAEDLNEAYEPVE